MDAELQWIAEATGASSIRRGERIQSLWGGYGELFRVHLDGAAVTTAVVKSAIAPPADRRSTALAHERKRRSYDVETAWYREWAPRCDERTRVARLLASRVDAERWVLVLEDLDAAGFAGRRREVHGRELEACLAWLAELHARFLGAEPRGLWEEGAYWHLATRPDELAAVDDPALRDVAPLLDEKLRRCSHRTIVHGDPKEANYCFGGDGVAVVDFQYVGGGCGMRDVAYLLSGRDRDDEDFERQALDVYFRHLRRALERRNGSRADDIEEEWRPLYDVAWADFQRFLAGWAKAHWSRDRRAQARLKRILRALR